ncbi:rRNA maturation RNase YbeY [Cypionkella sp.]|uniref:rRNA maturation RNase YbeY n=1 Tax=Cypionkella sp. TaxID=2811411 RepID=UPI002715CC71|nr:rRNA maturation RNase YbeY [Cypionkella sp.]MDO8983491.1 rRNA maturation RNase YbeY [Cypionkella sp.]MDP2048488.1 rRNA maturation RNase YbeY [Cypionkella sp.]
MEPLVDIVFEDARWEALGLQSLAEPAVRASFAELGLAEGGFTLCLMGCNDARILELNGDFRGKAKPTNVLSWPSEERGADAGEVPDLPQPGSADDPESLGDIAISYDTCALEATEAGKPLAEHVTHLIVHGLLHLLGYDHIRAADGDLMEATEVRILARLGLSDPY